MIGLELGKFIQISWNPALNKPWSRPIEEVEDVEDVEDGSWTVHPIG